MRNRRRALTARLVLAAAVAGLVGTAWAFVGEGRWRPRAPRHEGEAAGTGARGLRAGNGWFGAHPAPAPAGSNLQVDLEIEMAARLAADGAGGATGGKARVSGRWTVTLIEAGASASTVLAELRPAVVELDAPRSRAVGADRYRERIAADLAQPLLLEVAPDGRVMRIKADPRITASASSILRAIPAAAQLAVGDGAAWTAEEQDTAGRYQARYRRGASGEIVKQKVAYVAVDTGQGPRAPEGVDEYRIVRSDGRYTLAGGGDGDTLQALNLTEELRVQPGGGLALTSTTSWIVTRSAQRFVPTPRAALERLAALDWSPFYAKPPAAAHDLDLDIAKVGEYTTVAQILRERERLRGRTDRATEERRQGLEIALASLIRLDPLQRAAALAQARGNGRGRAAGSSDALLMALAQSGAPEAQRFLLDLLRGESALPLETKAELIVELSIGPHAGPELVEGLERLIPQPVLGRQALLGLGAAIFRLRGEDPALARQVLGKLGARLAKATEAGAFDDARSILTALGNAGHPESLAMLRPFLAAQQASVRAAAVGALRRVPGAEPDQILARLVVADAEEEVRGAAAKTIEARRRLLDAPLAD